ncbi:MAG TPA: AI-2E family transporter [Pseudolabrys sp.]|uniref:AI-2E family transporter n=1 Tax=Pseudolabrys sp. TaxID=1960880 RepID=UPI002DDC9B74|nr:AI-2E family transporter [Pseudolabrys sp.]HEV2627820.1 AI-2E family transporter [Pseudolabrys sp.]
MNKPETGHAVHQRRHSILEIGQVEAGPEMWRTAAYVANTGIFLILLIAAFNLARPVLVPAVSAFVLTMMLGPVSARAERAGIPAVLIALVLWVLVIGVFYGVLLLLAAPAVQWIGRAPEIGQNIMQKLHVLQGPLSTLQTLRDSLLPASQKGSIGVDLVSFVQPVVAIVAPGIGQMLIFFGALFFMLLGRSQFRRVSVALFNQREAKLRVLKIFNDIEHNLTGYLSTVTVINLCVGVGSGIIAWATGLPDPVAWAVLGFVLNYIPYIGALMVEVAMFLVGVVSFTTLTHAIIPPLLYLAMGTAEGHFITPSVIGHRLTLNPLTVFLSLVFWTWLWGPVGAFLSVPLLIIAMVAAEYLFPRDEPALPE